MNSSWLGRFWRALIGKPRDLSDRSIFHSLSLVAFLAWVGLGADPLSSSAYGPEEVFRTLGEHTWLAPALALAVIGTICILSSAYSRIIEVFPSGGGGYIVATKMLGPRTGALSGCALLVDYVLTITVSIAAACDAIFSFLPPGWQLHAKLPFAMFLIIFLTVLNIRGVKESVLTLMPIFVVFLVTHCILIFGVIFQHAHDVQRVGAQIADGFNAGRATLGWGGMALLVIRAYSMGGGTYTGIEAVSNGLPIMREPRVPTARRTMLYIAVSLSFVASGLLLGYLLLGVRPVAGKTLNAVLAEGFAGHGRAALAFVVVTLFSEGALLVVAAQAGFIDGPRVLANMAVDSWVPRRFAALSDRLTTQNGILLMGAASLAALLYTQGDVGHLVVMYSINIFVTFTLSMVGMFRHWFGLRGEKFRLRRLTLFGSGALLCGTILLIIVVEKFAAGGWITLLITGLCMLLCVCIRRHYKRIAGQLNDFDTALNGLAFHPPAPASIQTHPPVAVVLVGRYSGAGIHLVLNILKSFPGYFRSIVFLSVGVIDSAKFKNHDELEKLQESTHRALEQYVELATKLGIPASFEMTIGTDMVLSAEKLCTDVAHKHPNATFFAGQLIFREEQWFHRLLHNQSSFSLQKRLQWSGLTMVILPMRLLTP